MGFGVWGLGWFGSTWHPNSAFPRPAGVVHQTAGDAGLGSSESAVVCTVKYEGLSRVVVLLVSHLGGELWKLT